MIKPLFIKKLTKFLPIAIAVILLLLVYRRINFNNLLTDLSQINPIWMVVLIIIGMIQGLISTISWKISLSVLGIKVRILQLYSYYLVGGFVSFVLPGTVGGDAAKLVMVGKDDKKYKESFISLVMQRIIGVIVAITMFFIPMTIFTNLIENGQLKILLLVCSLGGIIFLLLFVFSSKVSNMIVKWASMIKISSINKLIHDLTNIFSTYRKHPKQLILMAIGSFFFNVTSLLFRYIIMLSLGIKIGLFDFFNIVIFVTVIVQIPISLAGLGVREGSYVYFYSLVGVSKEKALAFSLLEYIPGLFISMCATMLYLFSNHTMIPRNHENKKSP